LIDGRTFRGLEHLNETILWWLAEVADVRVHRQTKARPTSEYQALLGEGPHDDEATHLGPQAGSETPNPGDEGNGVTKLG
jgi:hypothetical protein